MRRLLVSVTAAGVLVAGSVVAGTAARSAASASYDWGGVATFPTNRTVDTAGYAAGTWSFTDRWNDATGANVDGKHREDYFGTSTAAGADATYDLFGTHRLARNGDYYPPNDDARFPELSADLGFVQLRPSAEGLDVRVVLSSLGERDSSMLTLALDTDGGTETSTLPRNAVARCGGCGVDRYVSVWGSGSEIATAAGAAVGTVADLRVDVAANVVSFLVPAAALGSVGTQLRAWLASGLDDGTGHYLTVQASGSNTTPGGGTGIATNIFDLAFVADDRAAVDERVQADMLAGGDIAEAVADIDVAALRAGTHRTEGEPASGPVERILVSSLDEGDGVDSGNSAATFQNPAPGDNMHFLGRLQGYLVDLPPGYDPARPRPAVVVLHGYNGYYDEVYFLAPAMRDAIRKLGYVGIYPLGRGDVQYEHDGEYDALEVLRASSAAYPIDATRVHVVGISMGGFGTTKLVTRHPDVFADGAVFVGGEQQDVNVVNDRTADYPLTRLFAPVVANLEDTPVFLGASAADADVGGAAALLFYEQLTGLGDEAHLKQYLFGTHEPAIMDFAVPQLTALWQRARRALVPPRVHFGYDTSWNFPPLLDDGDAWVDGLVPASGTQGSVDAEAFTLPRRLTALDEASSSGGDPTDRSTYVLRDSLRRATGTRPVRNALAMTLTNTARVTVDLRGLRVDQTRRYCVDVTTDGSARVRLAGLSFGRLRVAGAASTRTATSALLTVPAGTSHVVVAPAGVAPRVGETCPAAGARNTGGSGSSTGAGGSGGRETQAGGAEGSLARTGASRMLPGVAVLLLVAAAGVARRRRG